MTDEVSVGIVVNGILGVVKSTIRLQAFKNQRVNTEKTLTFPTLSV